MSKTFFRSSEAVGLQLDKQPRLASYYAKAVPSLLSAAQVDQKRR
jgi:hypothetical protein